MSPLLFNAYMDAVMKEGRAWRLLGLLYADDLVQCGELEEEFRVMVGWSVDACRRGGLTVNADKRRDGLIPWRTIKVEEVWMSGKQEE